MKIFQIRWAAKRLSLSFVKLKISPALLKIKSTTETQFSKTFGTTISIGTGEALLFKYPTGDYCLLVQLVLLFCKINLTFEKVFLGKIFSEAWDQSALHCLPEKRYFSIVRIASIRYLQAENCNTRLHESMSTWKFGFVSL